MKAWASVRQWKPPGTSDSSGGVFIRHCLEGQLLGPQTTCADPRRKPSGLESKKHPILRCSASERGLSIPALIPLATFVHTLRPLVVEGRADVTAGTPT
jgi:hypothetical protein